VLLKGDAQPSSFSSFEQETMHGIGARSLEAEAGFEEGEEDRGGD